MKVSIVCTNYNKEVWIEEAIESFLHQETNFDYEIIIIDDASTDNSPLAIKKYAELYPEKIRVFFNQENLGILKTWTVACEKAKGEYIARCDGDDFWTDKTKLQKQVDLLESSPNSKWCNSDFDYITSDGNLIYESAIKNNVIPFVKDIETLISQKGMTMSSTWLVEANLIKEVNQIIDPEATDDTFDIQIELFKRTELTFLSDSTTVYRMTENSDSRPTNDEKQFKRIKGLLKTQLRYISEIDSLEFKKMTQMLVARDADQEMRIQGYINNQHNLEEKIKSQNENIISLNNSLELNRNEKRISEARMRELEEQVQVLESQRQELEMIKASRTWRIRNFVTKLLKRTVK